MSFKVRRLSYALGAEIMGLDLHQRIDDRTFDALRSAFLEHCVLLFRGQRLSKKQHIDFASRFGELCNDGVENNEDGTADPDRDAEYPQIALNTNRPRPGGLSITDGAYASVWHTDRSFTTSPVMATTLHSIEIPEVGGDTAFANLYLAYETLSPRMKQLIEGLEGLYSARPRNKIFGGKTFPTVAHPVVRVHPESGRKSLYLHANAVKKFAGMTEEESKPLIEFLCNHATRPQFVYRHQWQKYDFLMWDNRCLNHLAVLDFDHSQYRYLERTMIQGTPSGYVYDEAKPMEIVKVVA